MMSEGDAVARLVKREMARRKPKDRARFLRELLAHGTAALAVIEGSRAAAESMYQFADAAATRGRK